MPSITPVTLPDHILAATFVGDRAMIACADGTVWIEGGPRLTTGQGLLVAEADAAGGRLVVAGEEGRVIAIRPDGTLAELAAVKGKWIDKLAIGPQGAVAFASGRTAWVRLADGTLKDFAHEKAVGGVAFLPKGMRLATATVDKALLHWVTAAGTPVEFGWKGAHLGITASPDGRFLVTTMQEPALHGWRIEDAKHMRMTGYPAKVKQMSWSAKGKWLATSGANAAIVWPFQAKDGPMGKAPLQLGANEKLVTAVACHPTEDVVAVGYETGLILAIRFADQAEVVLRHPGDGPVSAMGWDADGFRVAFGTEAGAAGIIDIRG